MPLIFNISHNLEFDCTLNTFNVHFWQGFSKISAFVSCTDNGNYVPFVLKLTHLIWKRNKLMKRNKSYDLLFIHSYFITFTIKKKINQLQPVQGEYFERICSSIISPLSNVSWMKVDDVNKHQAFPDQH